MKAQYGPIPAPVPVVSPLIITLETEEEKKDFLWLTGWDVTIPKAIAAQSSPSSATENHDRAKNLLRKIRQAHAKAYEERENQ